MADLKLPRINKAMIAGRITQDLDLRVTPKGTSTVRFTVAVAEVTKMILTSGNN